MQMTVNLTIVRAIRFRWGLNLQLRRQGFPSRVVMEDNLFKVRVGDFRTLDNAVAMELKLRLLGYNTFVVS